MTDIKRLKTPRFLHSFFQGKTMSMLLDFRSAIPKRREGFNYSIHGLRGLAALMVFVFHIYEMSFKQGFWPEDLDFLIPGLRSLSSGVELFFIISGFLIIGSLIRHRSTSQFLLDRMIRIYPVFLFLHILIFSAGPLIDYKWMKDITLAQWSLDFVSNLLFIPGVIKGLNLAHLNAWTLSYEAFFYVVAGFMYWAGSKTQWSRSWRFICISVVITLCVWRPLCLFFLVGIVSFWVMTNKNKLPGIIYRIDAVLIFIAFLIAKAFTSDATVIHIIGLVFIGWLLFENIQHGKGYFCKILHSPLLQYMGSISYSYYLWHAVTMFPLKKIVFKMYNDGIFSDHLSLIIFGVASFFVTLVVSHISYVILEDRAGRWLKKNVKFKN